MMIIGGLIVVKLFSKIFSRILDIIALFSFFGVDNDYIGARKSDFRYPYSAISIQSILTITCSAVKSSEKCNLGKFHCRSRMFLFKNYYISVVCTYF